MTKLTGIGAFALLASLGACGAPEQAAEDTAPAAQMTMDGPFAASEMTMDKAMKDAVGVDAADSWVRKMIAHHEGAIAMSRIMLGLQPSAGVATMAQATIDRQGAENEALAALAGTGTPDPASAALYDAVMMTMHTDMMGAKGANPSETYLGKMLAHHRGAVAMSDIALANGATGAVRTQIEKTRAEQLKEIAMVEALLRGQPVAAAMQPVQAEASAKPAAKAAAPKPALATSAASPAPVPIPAKPSAKPAAAADAAPGCAPDHRAAGHC